jgi:hypothetical protein
MAALSISVFSNIYLLVLLVLPFTAVAQAITSNDVSSTPTASSTYNVFSAIASSYPSPQPNNDDPGANLGPSDNPTPEDPNTAGASGDSDTAITLSTRDQIAIAVVVGLVAILGITSAVLFYVAKKRQWEVRASIRRSARRVTTAIKAKTPVRSNFSRRDRGVMRIDPPAPAAAGKSNRERDRAKRSGGILKDGNQSKRREGVDPRTDRDVEKGFNYGFGTKTKIEAVSKPAPQVSSSSRPKSSFEMDSQLTGNRSGAGAAGKEGKGRGWMKILERK